MKFLFFEVGLLVLPLLYSFNNAENKQFIYGLQDSYNLCDSIKFELRNSYGDSGIVVMIDVQRKETEFWSVFDEDITSYEHKVKPYGAYILNYNQSVEVSWHPCKLKEYSYNDFNHFFNGEFRFRIIVKKLPNSNCEYYYSETFKMILP